MLELPASDVRARRLVRPRGFIGRRHRQPVEGVGDAVRQDIPGATDGQDVGAGRQFQQPAFGRQRQHGGQHGLRLAVVRCLLAGVVQRLHEFERVVLTFRASGDASQQAVGEERLASVPAGEAVAVGFGQAAQNGSAAGVFHAHRRREAAQEAHFGIVRHAAEGQRRPRLGKVRDQRAVLIGVLHRRCGIQLHAVSAGRAQQVAPARVDQAERQRDVEGPLVGLGRSCRAGLVDGQLERVRVALLADGQNRRPGLLVPAPKLRQRRVGGVFHGGDEILDRHRGAIMAVEVEVGPGAESVAAEDGRQHAHHLGALFVHRGGVEVVDFLVALGPHRMRQRAAVLDELDAAQEAHVL